MSTRYLLPAVPLWTTDGDVSLLVRERMATEGGNNAPLALEDRPKVLAIEDRAAMLALSDREQQAMIADGSASSTTYQKNDAVEYRKGDGSAPQLGVITGIHVDDPNGEAYFSVKLESGRELQTIARRLRPAKEDAEAAGGGGDGGIWKPLEGKRGLWRELAPDEAVPVGSEVSLNLSTGCRWLKQP